MTISKEEFHRANCLKYAIANRTELIKDLLNHKAGLGLMKACIDGDFLNRHDSARAFRSEYKLLLHKFTMELISELQKQNRDAQEEFETIVRGDENVSDYK